MGQYRKKPLIVRAFQYDGSLRYSDGEYCVPEWAVEAYEQNILYYKDGRELYIRTLEGDMHVSVDDYIVCGIHGELYACKPAIFKETYEKVQI